MSDPLIQSDFQPASEERWLDAVEKALKGAGIERLNSIEPGGLARQPLYTSRDTTRIPSGQAGAFPFIRAAQAHNDPHLPWHIAQRVALGRKGCDNATILTDLMGGVSALTLDLSAAPKPEDMDRLLSGVMLDILPLNISAGTAITQARDLLDHLYASQNVAHGQRSAYLNADPIGASAQMGQAVSDIDLTLLSDLFAWGADKPAIKLFCADGRIFHDSGASEAQELGIMAANLVAIIRALSTAHPEEDLAHFFNRITLGLSADVDFFATIAKLRAARAIWAKITQACGSSPVPPTLLADTSERCFAATDPWVNILRATISAVGAALGGCDVLTVAPCTSVSDGDNALSRRIARNTQIILQEESHLGHVVDPAGGAWYIEKLTEELTLAAWDFFQKIEAQGGLIKVIASGWLAEQIDATRQARQEAINNRDMARIGVNEFPNLEEAPLTPRPPHGTGDFSEHRDSVTFESLRAQAENSKPRVFLAALGQQAAFSARVNFASNLYAVSGIHSHIGDGGTDIAAITAAFKASGCKIVCLCGTDAAYDDHAAALTDSLKQASATHIALAGKPRGLEGIDDYCFMGSDALTFSASIHRALGLEG